MNPNRKASGAGASTAAGVAPAYTSSMYSSSRVPTAAATTSGGPSALTSSRNAVPTAAVAKDPKAPKSQEKEKKKKKKMSEKVPLMGKVKQAQKAHKLTKGLSWRQKWKLFKCYRKMRKLFACCRPSKAIQGNT